MMRLIIVFVLLMTQWLSAQSVVKNTTLRNSSVTTASNAFSGPWISNIAVAPSTTSAVITFTTDVLGSTQLSYGADPSYGTTTTETDTSPRVLSHSVTVTGLSACSTYHFKARSKNASLVLGQSADATIYTQGCDALASPVPVQCIAYNPNTSVHIKGTSDIAVVRQNAINHIWRSTNALPTRQPDTITTNIGTTYTYLDTSSTTNLSNIDKLVTNMPSSFSAETVLLKPTVSNGKLAIIHQGHCEPGIANNLIDIGVKETINNLMADGFYVIGSQMPGCASNLPSASGTLGWSSSTWHINTFPSMESSTFNPMQYYLEPIATSINYATATYGPFSQTVMIGISGGGWTTTVYSALDPRITYSAPVSGSMPKGLRNIATCDPAALPEGDYEQGDGAAGQGLTTQMLLNIMSYEDMYIMASSQSRRQHQMIRPSDPCCFGGTRYQMYESTMNNWATYLGGVGFSVFSDSASSTHQISPAQRTQIQTDLGY